MRQRVNTLSTPKMTKEEAQQKTDAELLSDDSAGSGTYRKRFSDYMNCDFSHTYLTGLIRDRGIRKRMAQNVGRIFSCC